MSGRITPARFLIGATLVLSGAVLFWTVSGDDVASPVPHTPPVPAASSASVAQEPMGENSRRQAPQPAAMRDPETYAAVRLREIKAAPEAWAHTAAWQQEFATAQTPELRREVVGLARQVGPDSFLAVLPDALSSEDPVVRLDAVRSLALLPEDRFRDGVRIAANVSAQEIQDEVLQVITDAQPHLHAELFQMAMVSGSADLQKRVAEKIAERPNRELFPVLIEGLRVQDAQAKAEISEVITSLVHQRFQSFDEASRWWTTNAGRYDDMLLTAE